MSVDRYETAYRSTRDLLVEPKKGDPLRRRGQPRPGGVGDCEAEAWAPARKLPRAQPWGKARRLSGKALRLRGRWRVLGTRRGVVPVQSGRTSGEDREDSRGGGGEGANGTCSLRVGLRHSKGPRT